MYVYHIFFIDFSVDEHLGYFYVLAIVNSTAMKIGVYVSFRIMFFTGYMLRNEIAGSELEKELMFTKRGEVLGKG